MTPVTSRITKLSSDAEARDVKADQRFGPQRLRHEQQRLVERASPGNCSTQIVMPSGTQTSRPAIR